MKNVAYTKGWEDAICGRGYKNPYDIESDEWAEYDTGFNHGVLKNLYS